MRNFSKKTKTVKSTEKISATKWAEMASKDKRKHTSHYKGVPANYVAKFIEVDGKPYKMVDGVLVPLAFKGVRQSA